MIQGFSGGLLRNTELFYLLDLPTFQRDFAQFKTLDHATGPAITFTRASGATFFDVDGVLQTAANDAPRFDHDPANGESRGLLIEEQRTNLLLRSAEIDNTTSWGRTNSSVTANDIASPSGASTADKLVEDGSTGGHLVAQTLTLGDNTTYTGSVFVKAGERSWVGIALLDKANEINRVWFDASAGAQGETNGTVAGFTFNSVGNGWWRIALTASSGSGATTPAIRISLGSADNTPSYTGDGTSGLYIWGAQLEAGAFPTSYIPTTTATVTRSADSAVVTPISSFYNATESTLFHEATVYASTATSAVFQIDDTSTLNRLFVSAFLSSTSPVAAVAVGGLQPFVQSANLAAGTHKVCAAFKADDFAASTNGASAVTDTLGAMPAGLTHARIGSNATGLNTCHIRKVAYWPKRLSNTLLEQLTT
jgi:hypothetical protein